MGEAMSGYRLGLMLPMLWLPVCVRRVDVSKLITTIYIYLCDSFSCLQTVRSASTEEEYSGQVQRHNNVTDVT